MLYKTQNERGNVKGEKAMTEGKKATGIKTRVMIYDKY